MPVTRARGIARTYRVSDTAAVAPEEDVKPGREVPASLHHVVGECCRSALEGRGVGALGHDPDVSEAALLNHDVDLVEVGRLADHELEDGTVSRLEGPQHVGLVAPGQGVARVRQLR